MANATVESVNVGTPQPVMRNGELTSSAIWKEPLTGRVAVRGVNVDGDDQADRGVHGGPDQAVYAYAAEAASGGSPSSGAHSVRAPSGRT